MRRWLADRDGSGRHHDDAFAAAEKVIRSGDVSTLEERAVTFGHLPLAATPGSARQRW
jgi:hypothetical protein